jgi:hypothetical protein
VVEPVKTTGLSQFGHRRAALGGGDGRAADDARAVVKDCRLARCDAHCRFEEVDGEPERPAITSANNSRSRRHLLAVSTQLNGALELTSHRTSTPTQVGTDEMLDS